MPQKALVTPPNLLHCGAQRVTVIHVDYTTLDQSGIQERRVRITFRQRS
jgi:hypothetical protein